MKILVNERNLDKLLFHKVINIQPTDIKETEVGHWIFWPILSIENDQIVLENKRRIDISNW